MPEDSSTSDENLQATEDSDETPQATEDRDENPQATEDSDENLQATEDTERPCKWQVVGGSERGASHRRAETLNQDAVGWSEQPDGFGPIILSVSDGHGSAKYFRSRKGARLAVQKSEEVLKRFLESSEEVMNEEKSPLTVIARSAKEQLPKELVRAWRTAVGEDLEENPLAAGELDSLQQKDGEKPRAAVEENPTLAYGATVLNIVVTREFLLYIQLGDGDILSVSEDGEVRRPLAEDDRLLANETTSLCSRDAWKDFRVEFQIISGNPPALLFAATDGYSNSFQDDAGFLKVAQDFLGIIRKEGFAHLTRSLPSWLRQVTEEGSGDDITVGVISRIEAESYDARLKASELLQHRFAAQEELLREQQEGSEELRAELDRVRKLSECLAEQLEALEETIDQMGQRLKGFSEQREKALAEEEETRQKLRRLASQSTMLWSAFVALTLALLVAVAFPGWFQKEEAEAGVFADDPKTAIQARSSEFPAAEPAVENSEDDTAGSLVADAIVPAELAAPADPDPALPDEVAADEAVVPIDPDPAQPDEVAADEVAATDETRPRID